MTTNSSAKHSMRMIASGVGELLEDDDDGDRSSSACTATMTADIS